MELSYRLYQIATYGHAPSWRSRLNNPSATPPWPMPALDFWLEGVNGRRRRQFDDGLSRRPWED